MINDYCMDGLEQKREGFCWYLSREQGTAFEIEVWQEAPFPDNPYRLTPLLEVIRAVVKLGGNLKRAGQEFADPTVGRMLPRIERELAPYHVMRPVRWGWRSNRGAYLVLKAEL